jgi:lipoprotein-anchoring transpeptidase ErfK/SrfK
LHLRPRLPLTIVTAACILTRGELMAASAPLDGPGTPRRQWSRNLRRVGAACALLYLVVYGSDIVITARPDVFFGLHPMPARPEARPGRPWAYVPLDSGALKRAVTSEQGSPVFEEHQDRPDLANNDLYRRILAIRTKLKVNAQGVIRNGVAAASLRSLCPWIGAEVQWDGSGAATVFADDGVAVFTMGKAQVDRNYQATPIPAAPYVLQGEPYVPLTSFAQVFGMKLTRDAGTGLFILSKPPRQIRVLMDDRALQITISRSGRWVQVYYAGTFAKHYGACTGAGDNTPVGDFQVQNKAMWPGWRAYWGEYIPGGDQRNPLGARWLGTTARGHATGRVIGIHGTNQPSSIGERISGGCVRLQNANAIELYEVVPVGTRVSVRE